MIFFVAQWLVATMYGLRYSEEAVSLFAWFSGMELFIELVALVFVVGAAFCERMSK